MEVSRFACGFRITMGLGFPKCSLSKHSSSWCFKKIDLFGGLREIPKGGSGQPRELGAPVLGQ